MGNHQGRPFIPGSRRQRSRGKKGVAIRSPLQIRRKLLLLEAGLDHTDIAEATAVIEGGKVVKEPVTRGMVGAVVRGETTSLRVEEAFVRLVNDRIAQRYPDRPRPFVRLEEMFPSSDQMMEMEQRAAQFLDPLPHDGQVPRPRPKGAGRQKRQQEQSLGEPMPSVSEVTTNE
jgi:hypothetical protein